MGVDHAGSGPPHDEDTHAGRVGYRRTISEKVGAFWSSIEV